MAGHNKWSKIKHKKAVTDAKKAKEFSKFAQLIALESKNAGGDRNAPGVRLAVERAKRANMPNENIERALIKGASKEAANMEAVQFEAYGPGGVAIVATGVTDNNNRTASEIKHILNKLGYQLAEPGAAAWTFTKTEEGLAPISTIELSAEDQEKLAQITSALDEHDDIQDVVTNAA